MKLQLFSAADVAAALPMRECVEVTKRAFADFTSGRARVPQRTVMAVGGENVLLVKPAYLPGGEGGKDSGQGGDGVLLVKPPCLPVGDGGKESRQGVGRDGPRAEGQIGGGTGEGDAGEARAGHGGACEGGALGAKLVSFFPGNAARGLPVTPGLVVLLSPDTGEPLALVDGTFLTAWRTGAASGAATDLLAPPGAAVAAVFGAGAQARTQVMAIDTVRALEEIRIYSRTPSSLESFVDGLQAATRATLRAADSPRAAVVDADVICTATTSKTPVFAGADLKPGAHVNGVGSFTPAMQEVDVETVRRARIFVDSLASAAAEPGDLLNAIAAGVTAPAQWTELGAVVAGADPGRGDRELTFFKSVGLAVQDVAAGAAVLERAALLGLGRTIDF